MTSEVWEKQTTETPEAYKDRRRVLTNQYQDWVSLYGRPILKPLPDGTVEVIGSKEYGESAIRDMQNDAVINKHFDYHHKWLCPICHNRYLMRILSPDYPEGFLDKGGVLAPCVCLSVRKTDKAAKVYATRPRKSNYRADIDG